MFLDHLGIPAADIGFQGYNGVYHSVYDSFHWMEKFVDPTFEYHKVLFNSMNKGIIMTLASAYENR